jgi:MFS transporter, LPLT family, lysophospholipid transporter
VQNFNENTSILILIALYSLLLNAGWSIYAVILAFGLFVSLTMASVQLWYRRSRRRHGEEIERLLDFAAAEDPQQQHLRRRQERPT